MPISLHLKHSICALFSLFSRYVPYNDDTQDKIRDIMELEFSELHTECIM